MSRIINFNRSGRRIIVISDIHGHLSCLKILIAKTGFSKNDILIILGDFLQRGYDNMAMLDYIYQLNQEENIYVLSGNHEHYLCSLLEEQYLERLDYHMAYIHYGCIIREWIQTKSIEYDNLLDLQSHLKRQCADEIEFLKQLPYAIETEDYVFVHGGIKEQLEDSTTWDLLSTPEFLYQGHDMDKTVVVGHWPVQNYRQDSFNPSPIIDLQQRIIAIDGGMGVKSSGQINALIIDKGIEVVSLDELPPIVVKEKVEGIKTRVVKLDYQDKAFSVLKHGSVMSEVRKDSTGEVFIMLNGCLDGTFEDYISNFISAPEGADGKLIRYCDAYALIKLDQEIGWIEKKYIEVL